MFRIALLALLLSSSAAWSQQVRVDPRKVAQAAITYLDRTQITGAESETMVEIRGFLAGVASGQLTVIQTPPPAPPGVRPDPTK